MADEYTFLARTSFESWTRDGIRIGLPEGLPDDLLNRRAGCFVSLHIGENLRGCMGTIAPTQATLADEIIENAIVACSRDPRFPAVTPSELETIHCGVDVLGEAEDIAGPEDLDVKRYGVIVTNGFRRGLLLPDLDGVDTVEEQIAIAKQKAGIRPSEPCSLQRFEVIRHSE